MNPHFNIWLEEDGEVIFSIWRVRLLRAIEEHGSISAAAESLGVPYRVAWQKVNEMETRLDQSLVQTQTGGQHGGGATLTPTAVAWLDRFDRFVSDLDQLIDDRFQTYFDA